MNWQSKIFDRLKENNIQHVVYVPDAGHSYTIDQADRDENVSSIVLTSEQEGIGYLAGAWLGGQRGVLLTQSSGVGNCVNALSLQSMTRFPLLMIVTMRGEWSEFNPWQNPMGHATEQALKLMGVLTWRADYPDDVDALLQGAITMAFDGDCACALILGQRLIGKKHWVK